MALIEQVQAIATDPFDEILNLEDEFYQQGYELGVKDGTQAGRVEGRTFGLEKGFEKYIALGKLAGQCEVWQSRIGRNTKTPGAASVDDDRFARLASNSRVSKHIETLSALVDIETLSHVNNEESVAEFDERLKAAKGKAKVIANILGETQSHGLKSAAQTQPVAKDQSNIEDFGSSRTTS